MSASWELREGHVLDRLRELDDDSVQCCITSPPYYGLRDYDVPPSLWGDGWTGCLGHEKTPDHYVAHLVEVFAEVRRVLRVDGTLWLNLGDSYGRGAGDRAGNYGRAAKGLVPPAPKDTRRRKGFAKAKDLLGIPWLVAFALREDGWYLRMDDIWHKPNPMPESTKDRTTRAHEYLFMFAKSGNPTYWTHRDGRGRRSRPDGDYVFVNEAGEEFLEAPEGERSRRLNLWSGHDYFFDAKAIEEPDKGLDHPRRVHEEAALEPTGGLMPAHTGLRTAEGRNGQGANKRSVWTVATVPFPEAHFATFPVRLVEPMVLAGSASRACTRCGAPWERQLERTVMEVRAGPSRDARRSAATGAETRRAINGTMTKAATAVTTGFAPTCSHAEGGGRSLILDPFVGSGTVLKVGVERGRDALGFDLSSAYASIARRRLTGANVPFPELVL